MSSDDTDVIVEGRPVAAGAGAVAGVPGGRAAGTPAGQQAPAGGSATSGSATSGSATSGSATSGSATSGSATSGSAAALADATAGPSAAPGAGAAPRVPEATLTIDDLARATGVTVRNIRAYQSRGLLPPPQVRARTGYYGSDHEARLELIKDLQAEGVKLDTIKKLLDTTGGSTEEVVAFIRTVRRIFADEERQISSVAELAERFAGTDATALKRAQKMGLLREVDEGQFEEVSPRLMRAAQELHEIGIPLPRSLDVVEQLSKHAGGIARIYVDLFLDEVWKPFDSSGRPSDEWPRLYTSIEQLRRISGEAMVAVLERAISERLDVTFGRDLARTVRTTSSRKAEPEA